MKEKESYVPLRYIELWKKANEYAKEGRHEEAAPIISYMMQIWPERVIAKGEKILESDVPDAKLE